MKPRKPKRPDARWPGHGPSGVNAEKPGRKKGARKASRDATTSPAERGSVAGVAAAPRPAKREVAAPVPRRLPIPRDDRPTALYVVCAPGLERLTAAELRGIGLEAGDVEAGGVSLTGGAEAIQLANLHLRTASRVVARVGEFRVTTFYELEARARRIEWERWLGAEPVRLRVTCRKSKLYHSDAVAQRFIEAMAKRTGAWEATAARDAEGESEGEDAQMFVVRIHHDVCTVSVDTSGALLHRRGYRQAVGKAPLRETIAAAMLLASGWKGDIPLVDPLCGAGTIPIEGALLARGIAPGVNRGFAFMRWPSFDADAWTRHLDAARAKELPNARAPIIGSDRDAGAIASASANAARAGVEGDLELAERSLSAIAVPNGPGWLITNPPYGVRVGSVDRVRDLYAQLGHMARGALPGWGIGLLSPDPALDSQLRIRVAPAFETTNGGIKVRYLTGRIPG
jgi:putative N6-adenine-specific DNA methylase